MYVCEVCYREGAHALMHMWRSEDDFEELLFCFLYHMANEHQFWSPVLRGGGEHLHPPGHLAGLVLVAKWTFSVASHLRLLTDTVHFGSHFRLSLLVFVISLVLVKHFNILP